MHDEIIRDSAGTRAWYNNNDTLHRTDGPAIEYPNRNNSWYVNGVCVQPHEVLEHSDIGRLLLSTLDNIPASLLPAVTSYIENRYRNTSDN